MLVQPELLKPNILSEIEIKSGCVNLLFVFFVHMSVVGFFKKKKKVDFTKCQGLFCVLGMVMFVTGIITVIVLSFKYVSQS